MMLPEMTSSARVARAFQRFARGAGVGLALGALAACGGGGSSTPAKTTQTPETPETPAPEMTITQGGDTLANAVDVTGMETVEGELDSADDVDYYKIQVDEPTEVTLWVDTPDAEIQVLDSEGNVLATPSQNSGGGSGSGPAAASAATPQAFFGLCLLPVGHVVCIRLFLSVGSVIVRIAARRAITRGTKYALRQVVRKAGALIKRVGRVARKDLEVGKFEDIDCSDFFTTTDETTPISCSARIVSRNLGPFTIGIQAQAEGSIVRLTAGRTSSTSMCGDPVAPRTVQLALVVEARIPPEERVPVEIRGGVPTIAYVSLFERTLTDSGPRLRSSVTDPITLMIAAGSRSVTSPLTDFIESPGGGSLTFAFLGYPGTTTSVSSSRWFDVTRDGPRLTVTADPHADVPYGIPIPLLVEVTATDGNNVCRSFEVRVSLEGSGVFSCGVGSDSVLSADPNSRRGGCREFTGDASRIACTNSRIRESPCPRSLASAKSIWSCRENYTGGSWAIRDDGAYTEERFTYDFRGYSNFGLTREACERNGGAFTIHKRAGE